MEENKTIKQRFLNFLLSSMFIGTTVSLVGYLISQILPSAPQIIFQFCLLVFFVGCIVYTVLSKVWGSVNNVKDEYKKARGQRDGKQT